jgi:hypothetical protein
MGPLELTIGAEDIATLAPAAKTSSADFLRTLADHPGLTF